MINVNELRIGNLISDYQNNTIKVLGISDVYNDGNYYIISENGGSIDDDHKPIPLTPEILLKCGAINRYGATYYIKKIKFDVNTAGIVRFHYSGKVAYLDYLHQLQNLILILTNEELNINL